MINFNPWVEIDSILVFVLNHWGNNENGEIKYIDTKNWDMLFVIPTKLGIGKAIKYGKYRPPNGANTVIINW